MTNKKSILFSVVVVAIFIVAISSASYAFYTANVKIEKDNNSSFEGGTAKLSTTFDDGEEITITNLVPGDSITKIFSLETVGVDVNYKIVINDLINEFESYQDITYILKENDTILVENKVFPNVADNNELSTIRTLRNGEKNTYTLTITYQNTDNDQAPDMGKTISGKIFIQEV